MKFAFVDAEKAGRTFKVSKLCRALRVSTSGYYAWRSREPSERARKDIELRVLIRASFERSRRTYGSIRIHEDLVEAGEHVGRNRVIRIMQDEGIRARARKRWKLTTMSEHDQPIAPNMLARDFTASAPNQRWVGDTTELRTFTGGKFYLAAIVDLYSRYCVGWAVSASNDRRLTLRALEMAIRRRCPEAGLLHHSDQGSTYASEDYQDLLAAHGIAQHEPSRQLPRQRRDGELVLDCEVRARRGLRVDARREGTAVRLRRGLLQPATPALVHRLREPGAIREGAKSRTSVGSVNKPSTGADQAQGFDAMHLRDGYALHAADASVPYRTSLEYVHASDAAHVATVLDEDSHEHGAPLVLRDDRASCHTAPAVLSVLAQSGVALLQGPAYYPRTTGSSSVRTSNTATGSRGSTL